MLCLPASSLARTASARLAKGFRQIRSAMEKCPPYQAVFNKVRLHWALWLISVALQLMCS